MSYLMAALQSNEAEGFCFQNKHTLFVYVLLYFILVYDLYHSSIEINQFLFSNSIGEVYFGIQLGPVLCQDTSS